MKKQATGIAGTLLLALSIQSALACTPDEWLTIIEPDARINSAKVDIARAEVPLPEAIEAILPAGWHLYNPRELREPRVSIAPGATFDDALRSIARQARACITVDGARREVSVRPAGERKPDPRSALAPMAAAPDPGARTAGQATTAPLTEPAKPTPFASTDPQPALAPLPIKLRDSVAQEGLYDLRTGETLRAALQRWCDESGYRLVWRAPIDLRVEAAITFPPGTRFPQAVKQTLAAFWHARHSVTAKLYTNRVLVVDGRDS